MELPVDSLHDLLFCERVPFDRSCGKDPLGQEHPVELFCHGREKGNASKVLTLGLGITEEEPQAIRGLPQVDGESDPRMCPFVCPHRCLALCPMSCPGRSPNILDYVNIPYVGCVSPAAGRGFPGPVATIPMVIIGLFDV